MIEINRVHRMSGMLCSYIRRSEAVCAVSGNQR